MKLRNLRKRPLAVLVSAVLVASPLLARDIVTVTGAGPVGDGGPAASAYLREVAAVARAPDGSVYIAEGDWGRIRRVDPSGTISHFAGNGSLGASGDGDAATDAAIGIVNDIAVDAAGNVYVSDGRNH